MQLCLEQPHLEWSEWQDQDRIIQVYGVGMIWYRLYIKSLILMDALLFVFSIIPIGAHIHNGSNSLSTSQPLSNNATTSLFAEYIHNIVTASYTTNTLVYLYVYLALHGITLILHPIIYLHYLRVLKFSEFHEDPFMNNEPPQTYEAKSHYFDTNFRPENRHTIELTHIHALQSLPAHIPATPLRMWNDAQRLFCRRILRNLVSLSCFCVMLGLYGLVIWAIQSLMYNQLHENSEASSFTSNLWISLVLSITQSSTDVIMLLFAELLRYVEVHRREEVADKWECYRLLALRIFSINMFYAIRVYGLTSQQSCSATFLGVQHTLIVVCYFFGDFLADYLWPMVFRAYKRRYGSGKYGRDYETWYEFRLSEQYSTIAYRHIVLTTGSSFIPGLAILGCLGNWIQLRSDQYRVTHLCRISKRFQSAYQRFILILGLISLINFLIGYPKGVLFLWLNRQSFFDCDNLSTT